MSIQDKIERIIKQIHILFSESPVISGEENKVIVDKTKIFPILEQLNLAIYEMMDQYEATVQSRELAQRRTEKEGKDLVERISQQTEDIYAASLIYTDDALNQVQKLMESALTQSRGIWERLLEDLEQEKRRVKEDQMELTEQLRDFKDSRKYQVIIEEHNRERERLEKEHAAAAEKKIKNEARHFPLNIKPEIKVNPAYFERHKQLFGKEVTMWPEDNYTEESEIPQTEAPEEESVETAKNPPVAPLQENAASRETADTLSGHSVLRETAADILGAVLGKTSGNLGKPKGDSETEPKEPGLPSEDTSPEDQSEGIAEDLNKLQTEEEASDLFLLQPVRVEDIPPILLSGEEESLVYGSDSTREDQESQSSEQLPEDWDIPPMPEDWDIPPMPKNGGEAGELPLSGALEEEEKKPFVLPEVRVDLNAEYFKWKKENAGETQEGEQPKQELPRKKLLFGKKSGSK